LSAPVIPTTRRCLHTIHEVNSDSDDDAEDIDLVGTGEDRMEEDENEEEEFGSPTRLMNHFV